MTKISNSALITLFTKLLALFVIAKGISIAIWWYLPSDGVELNSKNNYHSKYQRVDFRNMILRGKAVKPSSVVKIDSSAGISITNMVLKGLYGTKSKGYIIVAMKSNPKKTTIVGIGENFQGYILKSITASSALLEKGGNNFILSLKGRKTGENTIAKKVYNRGVKTEMAFTRKEISNYTKNPEQIWKDISISQVKDGNNLKGFKVTKINKNSKFAALGLRSGDLIIKANNVILKSYKDALDIYENIDKLNVVQIVVIRDNKEVELVYEIN